PDPAIPPTLGSAKHSLHSRASTGSQCKPVYDCHSSTTIPPLLLQPIPILSAEWNQNEMKLFSRALEVCGKNFGAIKKDFLPWKSVKSIIEFYYLGIHRESTHSPPRPENLNPNATNQSENILNIKPDSISNSFALDILSSVSKFMACAQTKPQLNCDQRHNLHHFLDNDYDVKTSLDDLKASGVSGQEVKPLKAKPILPTAIQESRDISTVGSLKFYLDGQLVLKLNAQQELLGQKCQWVESLDTAKKAREKLHKTNKRLLIERHDLDLPNHSNHKYLNNDELDEASNESSDDDSLESNESALVPSPSAFIAKKAKVKLENNCLKPLSSPTSLSLKDQKMETNVSNPCNRLMKTECTSVKREHLSPNFATNDDIIEHKKRSSNETTNERRNSQNSLENKWYHTIVEKQSSLQPPKAHSAAPLGQTQRHSRYESTANSWGMSTSSSSSSSSTSSQSSSHSVPTPSQSVPSSAAPVDLTRKSTNYSPFETKSLSTSSSAPNYNSYNEKDKNSKMSSPSPPRLQSPFVFPFPSYLPLSPTQSQSKHKKEVKSSSNLCQKGYENRSQVKPSPPSSPSSMPSTTPPLPSQLAFIQNSLASYLPIYEQYYRYYYGYGMPAPNHSSGERQSSSQASKESDTNNKERAKYYVYFETSTTTPFQIRRIEELIKTPNGNVEAKVMCFFRRRDISGSLIVLADKHQSALEEEQEREAEQFSEKNKHQLKLRELFLSRQVETLPATHIRGKCSVTLLNETESLASYLNKEDAFFYTLVYDPHQKTLLADRGEIRVGQRYQAEVPPNTLAPGESDNRVVEQLETLVYTPEHSISDKQIDQYLIISRSVGTFARALDCSSSIKQPSLHMSAAAASRDITLLHAMQVLHQHDYDIGKAVCSLVPNNGPVLCRDEMEEWSASEANLFEEALEKYGKDFNDIRQDFLPWKSLKNLVEYYYMWKTTDRYVQQKRVKAVEAESKLKQVYIPNYNNKPNAVNGGMNLSNDANGANGRACESCYKQTSSQWYAWGPPHLQCRLCQSCYTYWKKFGGLKYSSRIGIIYDNMK
ncbi:unnamed protein product, partial [Medioppia subpectinata]